MTDVIDWLTAKGTYILVLQMTQASVVTVGRLGKFKFHKGLYFYVGSAFGSGGLKARLRHHANPSRSPRWHIDYFKNAAVLTDIIISCSPVHHEHEWAAMLLNVNSVQPAVNGFGASDCHCRTHLFYSNTETPPDLKATLESKLLPDFPITRLKQQTWACLLDF